MKKKDLRKNSFTGSRRKIEKSLPISKLPKSVLLVGYLEELKCETPDSSEEDMTKLLKNSSKKKPFVCASGDGRLVLIVSPDALIKKTAEVNPVDDLKSAVTLHTDFHGVEPQEIKKLDPADLDHVVFCGWLNHVIYSVPNYSERRGVPFIHEARDKGDGVPKAKEKPIVCISPKKDMIIMFGKEMCFTDRGIIG